jgi:hypothetical protein
MSSWFGFFDTEDFIYKIARTRYFKSQFTFLIEWFLAQVARSYIKMLLDQWIQIHPVVDFILGIGLSVFLILHTDWIYNIIQGMWHKHIYGFTRYFINEYTPENFKRWKHYGVIGGCVLLAIHLECIEISSRVIQIQILQFLCSYFIVEGLEDIHLPSLDQIRSYIRHVYDHILSFLVYLCTLKKIFYVLHLSPSSDEGEDTEDDEMHDEIPFRKSWMGLDDIQVIEDSPSSSLVVFQEE